MVGPPDLGPEGERAQAHLLEELAPQRLLVRLARLDPTARRRPDGLPRSRDGGPQIEEDSSSFVEQERPDGVTQRRERLAEGPEPVQPLLPRHRGVGRRGRREHEEGRASQPPFLRAEHRPLRERTPVGLLADEPDRPRAKLGGELREPCGGAREVGTTEIARARSRPGSRVRHPPAVRQELVLLGRLEQPGREAGHVQEPPEVVARIGEVGARGGGNPTGVDPAEDPGQPGCEDVGNVRVRLLRVLGCRADPRTMTGGARPRRTARTGRGGTRPSSP